MLANHWPGEEVFHEGTELIHLYILYMYVPITLEIEEYEEPGIKCNCIGSPVSCLEVAVYNKIFAQFL